MTSDATAAGDIPVFSKRLDDIMAAMLKGEAPNVGRFCGYCYTPVGKREDACTNCGRSTAEYAPVAKLPLEFIALYKRMRKRESLIVNTFAFAGLTLAVVMFIGLVALAVYRFDQSLWWLAGATVALIVGGRVFAGILGGWIGDSVGYDYAHRKLVVEWHEYEAQREAARRGETAEAHEPASSSSHVSPHPTS